MAKTPDYYHILGISPDADTAIIHRAYRALMLRHHPDHAESADDDAAKALNVAYRILGDPVRRAAYDRDLRASGSGRGSAASASRRPSHRSSTGAAPSSMTRAWRMAPDNVRPRGFAAGLLWLGFVVGAIVAAGLINAAASERADVALSSDPPTAAAGASGQGSQTGADAPFSDAAAGVTSGSPKTPIAAEAPSGAISADRQSAGFGDRY
jgi:curved DNA-binding protein CbpA